MEGRGCHCECTCEIGRRDQSKKFKMWIVWISKGLHEPLQCPACSYMTVCLWHDIHYGTGMSHNGFACLHFSMRLHTCVFDCVHSSSKFSSLCGALQCPLLIHSQNGCCQAEKLPSGVLMGLNRKLSSVGRFYWTHSLYVRCNFIFLICPISYWKHYKHHTVDPGPRFKVYGCQQDSNKRAHGNIAEPSHRWCHFAAVELKGEKETIYLRERYEGNVSCQELTLVAVLVEGRLTPYSKWQQQMTLSPRFPNVQEWRNNIM